MMNRKKMILAAFFLALGLLMPFLTGQIREIGNKLLPMHIPVLLCGFVCGWQYGLLVGFLTPLFRTVLFGMPLPNAAVCMAFELAVYGAMTGILYHKLKKTKLAIYISLFVAMMAGRVMWGLISILIYSVQGNVFTWSVFMGGAVLNAIPGIIVQIVLIPVLVMALEKTGVMREDEYVI